MRITKEPEERKQEILDTAVRLFYEKGYEKTSIADIAKAINVAQGLCYRYFPSKEVLFDTALDQYAQSLADKMKSVLDGTEKTIKQIILEMSIFAEADTDPYYKVFHGEQSKKIHDQLSIKVCEKLVPIVKEQFETAQANGEINVPDVDTAAAFCVYGQLGTLLSEDIKKEDKDKRIRSFLLFMLNL